MLNWFGGGRASAGLRVSYWEDADSGESTTVARWAAGFWWIGRDTFCVLCFLAGSLSPLLSRYLNLEAFLYPLRQRGIGFSGCFPGFFRVLSWGFGPVLCFPSDSSLLVAVLPSLANLGVEGLVS